MIQQFHSFTFLQSPPKHNFWSEGSTPLVQSSLDHRSVPQGLHLVREIFKMCPEAMEVKAMRGVFFTSLVVPMAEPLAYTAIYGYARALRWL